MVVRERTVDFCNEADILVVEDSTSVASLICEALSGLVRTITVARTGQEALDRLLSDPPTLVLLDHRLPDMTGLEVLRRLAGHGVMVPFVTITGHGDEKVAVEMMKLGAHDYLIKDENFLELLPAVVNQVLSHLETEFRLKAAEEELAAEELRYRELFDQMSSGVVVMAAEDDEGSDFRIIDFNNAGGRISRIAPEDAIDRLVGEVFPGVRGELLGIFRQVWRSGETRYLPEFFYQDQRIAGWQQVHVYRLPSHDVVAIYDDISERKKVEGDLRSGERKYRSLYNEFQTLLNAIPDCLSLLAPDLQVVWGNRSFQERFSQPVEGRHCYEIWRGLDRPCADCPVLECFRTGEAQEYLRKSDERTFGLKAFPLKNEAGDVVNVINLCTDITEKVSLREEAERASRLTSLGELAAGVAHEINNPNALILMNSTMLEEIWSDTLPVLESHFGQKGDFRMGSLSYSRVRSEIPRLQSEIGEAGHRIKTIVDDLKNFVRQGEGEKASAVDLNEVAQKAVRLVSSTLKGATRRFSAEYESRLPRITGHFGRLEQVVVNLLLNACQALPSADRGVFLATGWREEERQVVLEVRDEGVGIAASDLPRVTDPFFTTRRKSGGTGLGLSVSARIAEEHGGRLKFSSEPNRGTTVSLLIPVE